MIDWEVRDEPLPAEPAPEERPRVQRPRWHVLLLILPLLVVVAGVALWQSRQREDSLRADLQAAIDAEERARSFGLVNEAARLAIENASAHWLRGYEGRFRRAEDSPPLPAVTIADLQLRRGGTEALVTVNEGDQQRLRAYRLVGSEWRRAPLPRSAWGEAQTLALEGGATLRYRAMDARFAEQVAADWPDLLSLLPPSMAASLSDVVIEPEEFRAAASVSTDEESGRRQASLASPQLVRSDPWLSGEELVRYELAAVLLAVDRPAIPPLRATPNEGALQQMMDEVAALGWALSRERMDALREAWRARVDERWVSPFQLDLPEGIAWAPRPSAPNSDTAVTLLLADLLLRTGPDATRARLFDEAQREMRDWTSRLEAVTGQSISEIEVRLERHIDEGDEAALGEGDLAPPQGSVELVGTVEVFDIQLPVVFFPAEGGRGVPVGLEGDILTLPDGEALPGHCAPLFERVRLSGRWEDGRSLMANRVVVDDLVPAGGDITIPTVPEEAVMLFGAPGSGGPDANGNSLSLLLADGTTTPLVEHSLPLSFIGVAPDDGRTALFATESPFNCQARWFYTYEPARGMRGPWLVPSEPEGNREEIFVSLLTGGADEGPWLLLFSHERQQGRLLSPDSPWAGPSVTFEGDYVTGWRPQHNEVVLLEHDAAGVRLTLRLQSLTGGETTAVRTVVSSRGSGMFYLAQFDALVTHEAGSILSIERLDSGERYVLAEEPTGNVWSRAQQLVLLEPENDLVVIATRFFDPQGDDPPFLIAAHRLDGELIEQFDPPDGEIVTGAVACPNGELLVPSVRRIGLGSETDIQIHRWRPGNAPSEPISVSSAQFLGGLVVCLLDEAEAQTPG